jgi:hypothetical protein
MIKTLRGVLVKSRYFFLVKSFFILMMAYSSPALAKEKLQNWPGTYVQKGGGGGLTIEKEGHKLWIEIWRDPGPSEAKYEEVFFAEIHGELAKRLPHRGDVCPNTLMLVPQGMTLKDECKLGPPTFYHYVRIK